LHSSNWSNREKKREGNYTPQKQNKTKQFNRGYIGKWRKWIPKS
jgi:hypothetical protein